MAKTALVTGASGGIGCELAKILAANKYNLVLVARSEPLLQALKSELESAYQISVKVLVKDLAQPTAPEEIYAQLEQENIAIDALINNAGFGDYGKFVEQDWQKLADMLQVNIVALTHLTKLFLPGMVRRRAGKVMNVASIAAFQPGPLMAVYYATKSYVLLFSEAIANELKGTGVTVTVLCPGPTESGFQKAASLSESSLVKGKKMPTSAEVAEYGYRAMLQGKIVAVHDWRNWLTITFLRFLPRNLVADLVRRVQE